MGFAITWCAVPEAGAEAFLQALGLSATGRMCEIPDPPALAGRLDTGWRVVWFNSYDCASIAPRQLERLSATVDVLVCKIEEHVMASSAELWSAGRQRWRIAHSGEDGPWQLDTAGELPDALPEARGELEEAQRAEDAGDAEADFIFEIPLRVAEGIVGFKHDGAWTHLVGGQFEALE